MKKHPCLVCGKKQKTHERKFPKGSIWLCNNRDCLDTIVYGLDDALAVARFSVGDVENEYDLDSEETEYSKGFMAFLRKMDNFGGLAGDVEESFWNDDYACDAYHAAIKVSVPYAEQNYIKSLKDSDLPLIDMEDVLTDQGKKMLENRLKGV